MNKPIFRIRTKDEDYLIRETIESHFGTESLDAFKGYNFWIKEGKIEEAFAVPHESSDLISKTTGLEVYFAGIPIGSIWSNTFLLEIEGAKMVSYYASKKIIVKTDQFLYGKPIFKENISKFEESFEKNDLLIVMSKSNIFYGIGKAEVGSNELHTVKQNTVVLKGSKRKPLDVGWYLREGS